jgi:putative tricarboxylic transport membrane protein
MNEMSIARKVIYGILGAWAALSPFLVLAQAYPTRPVEVIVHTSAGSGGDIVSRAVGEIMRREKLLTQPLVINNRVGGSGALAFNFFKGKRGDPYFMLSVTSTCWRWHIGPTPISA